MSHMKRHLDDLIEQHEAHSDTPICYGCASTLFVLLGAMGRVAWVRCRACGLDQRLEYAPDDSGSFGDAD